MRGGSPSKKVYRSIDELQPDHMMSPAPTRGGFIEGKLDGAISGHLAVLLDHLVGEREQRWRGLDAKGLGLGPRFRGDEGRRLV
jgi:hypothetical protein